MVQVTDLLNFSNPVFTTYLFWTGVLVLKLFFVALLTSFTRMKKMVRIHTFCKDLCDFPIA